MDFFAVYYEESRFRNRVFCKADCNRGDFQMFHCNPLSGIWLWTIGSIHGYIIFYTQRVQVSIMQCQYKTAQHDWTNRGQGMYHTNKNYHNTFKGFVNELSVCTVYVKPSNQANESWPCQRISLIEAKYDEFHRNHSLISYDPCQSHIGLNEAKHDEFYKYYLKLYADTSRKSGSQPTYFTMLLRCQLCKTWCRDVQLNGRLWLIWWVMLIVLVVAWGVTLQILGKSSTWVPLDILKWPQKYNVDRSCTRPGDIEFHHFPDSCTYVYRPKQSN